MHFISHNPTQIIFGVDFIEILKQKSALFSNKKVLLLSSKSFTDEIEEIKNQCDIDKILFIPPNPELQFVRSIWDKAKSCESIIALGGGSVVDCAKALSLNIEFSEFEALLKNPNPMNEIPKAQIIAIPTTSGTSSELTAWGTIWDSDNNAKYSLHLQNLHCQSAIYDMNLMRKMPLYLTINTALDALSHSVESIWNKNANPISTHNAIKAIELITAYLVPLSKDLDSVSLREQIALASIHAGLAFSNTKTALAHAISYPITMRFGIPHGLACSFSLPILLDALIQSPQNKARQEAISYLMPYKDKINQLFKTLHIKTKFDEYGLSKNNIIEIFDNLNSRAKNGLIDIQVAKEMILGS